MLDSSLFLTNLQPLERYCQKKILLVDDIPSNIRLMRLLLSKYDCDTASCGQEALERLKTNPPDLILLDVMMPNMNGFEVCAEIKNNPRLQHIPIIMVTALDDKASKLKGLNAGASEFLSKPIDPAELAIRVSNVLKIKEYGDFLSHYNDLLRHKLDERTRDLETSYQETIMRLTISAEFKDNDTGNHIKRISHYTRHLGELLNYHNVNVLELSSPMHDIGKIGIPDYILLKKGKLTSAEFEIMKNHTRIGGKILDNSVSLILQTAKLIALYHHERWDGSGYPFGLAGNDIPIEGRIIAIADQYDALRMCRPYKPAFTHEQTFKIITQGDGRTLPEHFCPRSLEAFIDTHLTFADIFDTYTDDE